MNSQSQEAKTATQFNYDVLDFQQRNEIEQTTAAIKERLRKAAQDIWEIGRMLSEVQSKLQRGQFDDWIKTEFDWSRRTAYKFISVYKRFDRRVNLEEINIATSALYLLAAESTPDEIREDFIQKARQGEKVTHREVSQVVREARSKSTPAVEKPELLVDDDTTKDNSTILLPTKSTSSQQLTAIPTPPTEIPLSDTSIASNSASQTKLIIERGWYQLSEKHRVYCGDTALSGFSNRIPYAELAIAITANDWAHDWLIEKAKTIVVFPESEFDRQKLTGLIVMFSASEDKIIFPWLPYAEMITVTHQLGRRVYAGDINAEKCQAAVNSTGLTLEAM